MKINFGEIVSCGYDYIDASNAFHRTYPGPNYISHANPKLYDAYRQMDRAERAMTVVCYVLEIPTDIPIRAARIMEKACRRATDLNHDYAGIDAERVIRSLLGKEAHP